MKLMQKNKIDHEEWKIIAGLFVFSAIWVLLVVPYLINSPAWNSQNPIVQYVLYQMGYISLSVAIFGSILTMLFKQKFKFVNAFRNGVAAWLSMAWVFDLMSPPNYIDPLGNIVITNAAALPNASVDAMFVYIFDTITPWMKDLVVPFFNISAEWVAVYMAVPVLTLALVAFILTGGKFRNWVEGAKSTR